MTDPGTGRLVALAMILGIAAAWVFCLWLHIRLVRRSRAAARRVVRLVLPMELDRTLAHLVQGLNRSPHFFTSIKGRVEGVLTATIRSSLTGAPAVNLACRLDDLGQDSRARLRLDFTPMIDRTRRQSRAILMLVWPSWLAVTIIWVALLHTLSGAQPSPWFALNLFHAAYPPVIGAVLIQLRFRRERRRLGDSVVSVIDSLRFIPRGV